MGFFKIMIELVLMVLLAMLLVRGIDEWKYSHKVQQELDDNNATCYFDRGWFNLPLAKICSYSNDTIVIKKESLEETPL